MQLNISCSINNILRVHRCEVQKLVSNSEKFRETLKFAKWQMVRVSQSVRILIEKKNIFTVMVIVANFLDFCLRELDYSASVYVKSSVVNYIRRHHHQLYGFCFRCQSHYNSSVLWTLCSSSEKKSMTFDRCCTTRYNALNTVAVWRTPITPIHTYVNFRKVFTEIYIYT